MAMTSTSWGRWRDAILLTCSNIRQRIIEWQVRRQERRDILSRIEWIEDPDIREWKALRR